MRATNLKAYYDDKSIDMKSIDDLSAWQQILVNDGVIKNKSDLTVKNDEVVAHQRLLIEIEVKEAIDISLEKSGVDSREQLVTTANGLQFALSGLSILTMACAQSKDEALKKAAEPLLPFAQMFLKARETGDMPIDVLGVDSVAAKVITTSVTSGKVVKQVLSAAQEGK